jgi:hypothetical protein
MRATRLVPGPITGPITGLMAVGAAALLLGLTGCSGGGADQASPTATDQVAAGGGGGAPAEDGAVARDAAEEPAASQAGGGGAKSAVQFLTQQALIKTGAVALRSDDVGKTRYDVQVLVDEHNGQIADDQTETDKTGAPLRARMVLRVPVDQFDDVMGKLARLATLASTTTTSEDVTTQLIDVEARIKVQQASVDRVRQLLARAQTIRDIMAIESEVSRRQADLDSLTQQEAYLKDQTSMSTIKVDIEREPDAVAPKKKDDDSGFLAGLAAGWSGLKTSVVAVATVVGAVLPFSVVALVLGLPVWLLVRRLRRTPPPAPAPVPSGE